MRKAWSRKQSKAVPWNNDGEQSDPNTKCTLIHVGPTMRGALTITVLALDGRNLVGTMGVKGFTLLSLTWAVL